jgi:hypothetical protein
VRLRYVGAAPTTFMAHGVGEVQQGGEFTVPDGAAEGFLSRLDVERAEGLGDAVDLGETTGDAPPAKTRKTAKPAAQEPAESGGTQTGTPTMTA